MRLTFALTWPPEDTSDAGPPGDHYYASALWLCGRHPQLVQLVERVHGAVVLEADGLELDLSELADSLDALDAYLRAWRDYRARTYEPESDGPRWQAWEDAGPQLANAGARCIAPMSRTEVSRLRLLAFFAPSSGEGRRLTASDVVGLDDAGRRLLHDWTRAVLAA